MYQSITLVGNLGSAPEMRYTPSGVAVASFSVAVNKTWTNQDGQRQDKTTWFRVTCWRKQAEIVSQYLTKGARVMVIGELEDARPWTDRDGNQRASLEITAQIVKFLGGNAEPTADSGGTTASGNDDANGYAGMVSDEDIPF